MAQPEFQELINAGFSENYLRGPCTHPKDRRDVLADSAGASVCPGCQKKFVSLNDSYDPFKGGYCSWACVDRDYPAASRGEQWQRFKAERIGYTPAELEGQRRAEQLSAEFKEREQLRAQYASVLSPDFYRSREWREVRYDALLLHGGACQCCGATHCGGGPKLHVDHIVPRSVAPDLALDVDNLQVLCEDCNLGKGARDATDWRESA